MISYFRNPNFVFFGTPEFAAIILERLIKAGFAPGVVVCNPDRPVGRKKILTSPPTKIIAQKYDIPVWQPENLKTKNPALNGAFAETSNDSRNPGLTPNISILNDDQLSSPLVDKSEDRGSAGNRAPGSRVSIPNPNHSGPTANLLYREYDFFVVAAYAKILPKEILEIPRLGSIGIHPSLLPKYRGPSPIQSAILNGEKETGVTLFLMDEKVDHGPVLAQKALENYELGIMNYESLMRKLAELGGDLLVEFLNQFREVQSPHELESIFGRLNLTPQDESRATYTKKFKTEDAFIEPADLENARSEGGEIAIQIERKIRALNPEPGVFTLSPSKGGPQRIKILEAELINGKLRRPEGVGAPTRASVLKLKKIQIEGGKPVEM
ncbi:hypothetical protein HYV91_03690 [Candidatus Wolfebacteria bacterium]|nr:hypothetical protein [Candidatus Wolfebacteria bacterium]